MAQPGTPSRVILAVLWLVLGGAMIAVPVWLGWTSWQAILNGHPAMMAAAIVCGLLGFVAVAWSIASLALGGRQDREGDPSHPAHRTGLGAAIPSDSHRDSRDAVAEQRRGHRQGRLVRNAAGSSRPGWPSRQADYWPGVRSWRSGRSPRVLGPAATAGAIRLSRRGSQIPIRSCPHPAGSG